jgi:hypothetical protein
VDHESASSSSSSGVFKKKKEIHQILLPKIKNVLKQYSIPDTLR